MIPVQSHTNVIVADDSGNCTYPYVIPVQSHTNVIVADDSGNCTYGAVRLVGGSNQYEGRVEVCIDDQWGMHGHFRDFVALEPNEVYRTAHSHNYVKMALIEL